MNIIEEYKETRKELKKTISSLKAEHKGLIDPNFDPTTVEDYFDKVLTLEERIRFLNLCVRNLEYSISWMSTGKCPNDKHSIENIRVVEKYL